MNLEKYIASAMKQGKTDDQIFEALSKLGRSISKTNLGVLREQFEKSKKVTSSNLERIEAIAKKYDLPSISPDDIEGQLGIAQVNISQALMKATAMLNQDIDSYSRGENELPVDLIKATSDLFKVADKLLGIAVNVNITTAIRCLESSGYIVFRDSKQMIEAKQNQLEKDEGNTIDISINDK
jgi:hypothetical protein